MVYQESASSQSGHAYAMFTWFGKAACTADVWTTKFNSATNL